MRKLYISIAILLAAGIVGFVWHGQTDNATQTFGQPTTEIATSTDQQSDVVVDVQQPGTASVQAAQTIDQPVPTNTTSSEVTVCESVRIVVGSTSYEPCVSGKASVLSAMLTAAEKNGLVFVGREYPSLGLYIESINGKKPDGGYSWFLYINGISSTEGASTALVSPGETIEWRYKQGY